MIKVICGPKGTGKSKEIIALANKDAVTLKGISIFITKAKHYMYDLDRKVKYIDVDDYGVSGEDAFLGFIKGVVAADSDTEFLYLDGAARICEKDIESLEGLLEALDKLSSVEDVTIVLTCSYTGDQIPEFVKKYM